MYITDNVLRVAHNCCVKHEAVFGKRAGAVPCAKSIHWISSRRSVKAF
jgi:hypothetical protein